MYCNIGDDSESEYDTAWWWREGLADYIYPSTTVPPQLDSNLTSSAPRNDSSISVPLKPTAPAFVPS
jgi:hypothetical protein